MSRGSDIAWRLDRALYGDVDRQVYADIAYLLARIETITELHQPHRAPTSQNGACRECWHDYPCPTVRAARGDDDAVRRQEGQR